MTADLMALERKVDLALAKTDLVLARLEEMSQAGKPGMRQIDFARLMKVNKRTVARWVAGKKLRLEKGLIPNSEVKKFLT